MKSFLIYWRAKWNNEQWIARRRHTWFSFPENVWYNCPQILVWYDVLSVLWFCSHSLLWFNFVPTACYDVLGRDCFRYKDTDCVGPFETWARANCSLRCGYCPRKSPFFIGGWGEGERVDGQRNKVGCNIIYAILFSFAFNFFNVSFVKVFFH